MIINALPLLALLQGTPQVPTAPQSWTPHRVFQSADARRSDFEALASAAASADVVFFGEQHDDAGTHRMELALLESIARRRNDVIVSVEMFERDVQGVLDKYLAGSITEAAFLAAARPWPNYAADYRPLVEFARTHGWRVIAANVPRPMASAVSTKGLDAITTLSDSTRSWAAAEFQCGKGRYFDHFVEAMGGHGATADAESRNERYFQAQCVKDETMAESIAHARQLQPTALVVHYNGAFHSDFGDGTAERVRRRLPQARTLVISAQPQSDLDAPLANGEEEKGDWIVYTLKKNN